MQVDMLEGKLEGIGMELMKLLGAIQVKPLGKDRFDYNPWWFDGMSLLRC